MAKTLKIGLIGAGGIMRWAHLNPGWTSIPDIDIVAVADINRASAEKLATEFKIPQVFTDYKDLLKVEGLDAVDICTPNNLHAPCAIAALQAGLHVLCEKPLATTVKEVKQIAAAAEKAGKLLMTAQHMRFDKPALAIKQWADGGNLGEVYHARVLAIRRNGLPTAPTFIDPKLSGGGPCMDIGVHALDTAMHIMGFPNPVRASGRSMVNFAKGNDFPGGWGEWDRQLFGVEDFASGYVVFDNGASMNLEASWLGHQEGEDFSFQLWGKKAGVCWPSRKLYTLMNGIHTNGELQPPGGLQPAHTEEIKAFVKAIRESLPSPVPVEQTVKVIAILEAIMRSSAQGKEVKVNY
ncbi:MAG: Gfo/Idh/MocA family oxidoreductase [Verrucomicrobiota bacterium]|nr:Gfo/Idh/MocA family oxidoreductase [Verrucomicrobiota bacterium]